jgi:predicted RNA-binding Zn-ribbon protein involved in translation (DUF1610 family)
MTIQFKCPTCGQAYSVPEQNAGKKAKCKACGNSIVIPGASPGPAKQVSGGGPAAAKPAKPAQAPPPTDKRSAMEKTFEKVAAVAAGGDASPAAPAPSRQAALHAMKCASCGGKVEFKVNQGGFQCKFCGSQYNATTNEAGKAVVQTVMLRELKKSVDEVSGELRADRLQKKAAAVQDQLDFKYVEFFHSLPRKAGSAAFILWIIGAIILIAGSKQGFQMIIVGLAVIGAGVGAFLWFKQADKVYKREAAELQQEKLEPIYDQLRKVGAVLEGGNISLGYTESTSTPQRYCVSCHQNVTPNKGKGGVGGLTGINFFLTVITCGAWLPAWILIGLLTRGSSAARRAMAKGKCPMCGGTPLFPSRIINV